MKRWRATIIYDQTDFGLPDRYGPLMHDHEIEELSELQGTGLR